jgi:hypothetical protein
MPHAFLGAKSKRRLIFTSRFAGKMILLYSSLGGLRPDLQQFGSGCAQKLTPLCWKNFHFQSNNKSSRTQNSEIRPFNFAKKKMRFTAVWIALWPFIAGDRHPFRFAPA